MVLESGECRVPGDPASAGGKTAAGGREAEVRMFLSVEGADRISSGEEGR